MLLVITALLAAAGQAPPSAEIVSEFTRVCVAPKSLREINDALVQDEWVAFIPVPESTLARIIDAVRPMLKAQGIASNYKSYARQIGPRHVELAVSETSNAITSGRKLIGCNMYDFAGRVAIDPKELAAATNGISEKSSEYAGMKIMEWKNPFGPGSGMRAVFMPQQSEFAKQAGFTGMMLGTHFLDGVK